MKCAPSKGNNKLSCYSTKSLQNIAQIYNQHYGGNIKYFGRSKETLWRDIREALSDKCDNEYCWIKKLPITNNKEIERDTFRPAMPKSWIKTSLKTWLDSDDIDGVMKQYEYKYPDFFFIGPVPLDCNIGSKLSCSLTNFNINKMVANGIRKIAVVYNTDTSDGPGEHWQALTCIIHPHTNNSRITFFDSFGTRPSKEIQLLMERLKNDLKNGSGIDAELEWNKKKHQTDTYNCGMYSIYFIVKTLEGNTLNEINSMDLSHNKMQQLKKEFYNPPIDKLVLTKKRSPKKKRPIKKKSIKKRSSKKRSIKKSKKIGK
jgi:hypothetical protein